MINSQLPNLLTEKTVKKISRGFIFPSAAFTIRRSQIKFYEFLDKQPRIGDLVYGAISWIGQHSSLENSSGRIHMIYDGTKAIFVFANRYAPDFYEGLMPDEIREQVDLLSQSGIIGIVKTKNSMIKDPTRVKILGYVCNESSLKDILHMNDAGANPYADFTYLGYPSTYLLPKDELLGIFNQLDLKYANNPKNFWVVEFADGIIQRETSMLLNSPEVTSRIHKLIFCANDAFGAIGGLNILENFGLEPDALSGICSSSPLHVRELSSFSNIPVFSSTEADIKQLSEILLHPSKYPSPNEVVV